LFLSDSQIQNRKDEFGYKTPLITKVDDLGSDLNKGRENTFVYVIILRKRFY